MGARTRLRATSVLRGPVSREVLDRYAVVKPIDFVTLKAKRDTREDNPRQQRTTVTEEN
jgi:hypothetical protein